MIRFKDTDYLYASARVRALEKYFVTGDDLVRMTEAKTLAEAFKIINDKGIGVGFEPENCEEALTAALSGAYALAQELLKDEGAVKLFRLRYDGFNLKTLIKGKALGADVSGMLSPLGSVSPEVISAEAAAMSFKSLEPRLAEAAAEAAALLAKTSDPQLVDITLDKAVLETQAALAGGYDCAYLNDIISMKIDLANIRAAVRIDRIGAPDPDALLRRVIAGGGSIPAEELTAARGLDELTIAVAHSRWGDALAPALRALKGAKQLTAFEKSCEELEMEYISRAKLKGFGAEPVFAYLLAFEAQIKNIRIVISSKAAGVSPDVIRERLRSTYV